jgi:hypothetical protein
MYGSWFAVTFGGIGVVFLCIAAAFLWAPLFALAAFAAIGTVLLVVAALRRAEDVPGREVHAGDPERYAAPASGEGASGSEEAAGRPERPEPGPEPQSTGAWGERR